MPRGRACSHSSIRETPFAEARPHPKLRNFTHTASPQPMTDYLYVLALALMPAFGNFAGGVVAELIPTSRRMLNCALHAAAGIVTAVVAVELMPRRWRFSTALGHCSGPLPRRRLLRPRGMRPLRVRVNFGAV